jgi:hypothetical protein
VLQQRDDAGKALIGQLKARGIEVPPKPSENPCDHNEFTQFVNASEVL